MCACVCQDISTWPLTQSSVTTAQQRMQVRTQRRPPVRPKLRWSGPLSTRGGWRVPVDCPPQHYLPGAGGEESLLIASSTRSAGCRALTSLTAPRCRGNDHRRHSIFGRHGVTNKSVTTRETNVQAPGARWERGFEADRAWSNVRGYSRLKVLRVLSRDAFVGLSSVFQTDWATGGVGIG